jgi:hypothetical protein
VQPERTASERCAKSDKLQGLQCQVALPMVEQEELAAAPNLQNDRIQRGNCRRTNRGS